MADPLLTKRPGGALPGNLQGNPRLSHWIRFERNGSVSITGGKVEIGQGILTSLAQIAAEELDVRLDRIRMVAANTASSPNEGVTSGSLSIQDSGVAIRYVCAEVRAILLQEAAAEFGVAVDKLKVTDGTIAIEGRATTTNYWALATDALFDRNATAQAPVKNPADYTIVGKRADRLDLPDKVMGRARYVHDMVLPGMLFGRVVRPSGPRAKLDTFDVAEVQAIGATVVRDGSFLGVLAEREELAVRAAERLSATARWTGGATMPDADNVDTFLRTARSEATVLVDTTGNSTPASGRVVRASYAKPFIAHASIGPSCAIAQWDGNGGGNGNGDGVGEGARLTVHSHSQGIFNLRADLAKALRIHEACIAVHHVEGAGCYGHNGADDVALDAALLARAANGRPVQVVWTREQELGWAPFGSAMAIDLQATLDAEGKVVAWRHELFSHGHSSRPGRDRRPTLLAAAYIDDPFDLPVAIDMPLPNGGSERNAVPQYDFPRQHISKHRVTDVPIRVSAMRSLGGFGNVFAIESFMDELAVVAGVEPVAFRLRHLSDARGRAVIEAAAKRANWYGYQRRDDAGHGIAFSRYKNTGAYAAVVAEVRLEREVRVTRLVCAVDVGLAINPDGVINQVEGGALQATSWTLKEAVRFDRERITSVNWDDYPILKFSEVPAIEVELINRIDTPAVGAGEAVQALMGAAIANAVADALGVRIRSLPLTAERIQAAIR
ncbi:MAG: molybdopterin cofactor-binding domain-containing protein [Burkholderiales bacterium]